MFFGRIINFIQIFSIIILIIKLCNAGPWSANNNPYGVNEGRSNFLSQFSPSMMPYGQFGGRSPYGNAGMPYGNSGMQSPYGNSGMQGFNNPYYSSNIRPISSYSPYNNYFPLYGGQHQQQNRFGSPLSYPFNGGYRAFGGPYT